ncbi:hypothetical protein Agub_g14519, partial [Astrephomene gubernaculifera]
MQHPKVLPSTMHDHAGRRRTDTVDRVFGRLRALLRRYVRPCDEILILGDLNARVASLSDIPDLQADAELEAAAGVSIGGDGLIQGMPSRRSKDLSSNPFGQGLVELCREAELIIMNGRVPGDMEGEFTFYHAPGLACSMIDLFVCTPALFSRASHLQVLGIPIAMEGPKVGSRLSDHCPVSLTLDVGLGGTRRGGNAGSSRLGKREWE